MVDQAHSAEPEAIEALRESLRQREHEIELLKDTALVVGRELDLELVLQLIAQRAREIIQAETLLVPVLDESRTSYTYQAGAGRHAAEIVGETLPLDQGICGWVWRHERPWWRGVLEELGDTERTRWEQEAGTVILVPLIGKGGFLGGLAGMKKLNGGDFTRSDLNLLSLFASQVVVAIENAMAFEKIERARREAEGFQQELQQLNRELAGANEQLEYLSLYDALTGLPNRSLFRDRLSQALQVLDRECLAVLLIDLDEFKTVNESLGHDYGDRLLKQVAERFSAVMGTSDTVGRMGSDEFAVLTPCSDVHQATAKAGELARQLEREFILEGEPVAINASIGIAVAPEHGNDAVTVLRHADLAMHFAKRSKQTISLYDQDSHEIIPGHLNLLGDLREALTEGQFELYYQPKIDIRTNRLTGVEALARWEHPQRGFIPPTIFIHALEHTGLIAGFNRWVLDTVARQILAWRHAGMEMNVAVNLSVPSLLHPDFAGDMETLLREGDLRSNLTLEITENLFMSDYDRLKEVMNRLQRQGVEFSIDDFGTGYSSLSRLKKLPVSELKIDRSFVSDMHRSPDDAVIVRSTIELARNLGLTAVAEGVEDEPIAEQLRALGCDVAQGYHFCRPVPAEELVTWIRERDWHSG